LFSAPAPHIAAHGIITALIPKPPQFLEEPDQGQALAGGLGVIQRKKTIQILLPGADARQGLAFALVVERGCSRAQNLADSVACDVELAGEVVWT
jgi:hypothetical protein